MEILKYMSWVTTCSVFIALSSILYQAFVSLKQLNKLTTILTGLVALEGLKGKGVVDKPKVAVGYGSCSDLFISATSFLNFTGAVLARTSSDLLSDDITTEEQFLKSFAFYFKNGAAAERFTPNDELFTRLIKTAKTLHKNDIRWALGGNAPIMGVRFFKEGADVLLAARMSHKLKKHLPEGIKFAGDIANEDDIHLILEYKSGETWGPYTAPRANRYILHNDQNNPQISSLEYFEKVLKEYEPRLLVVSGIQMMDSYKFPPGVRENRLFKVKEQIASQPNSTLIHFEMASYVEMELLKLLLKYVIPYTDSIGMNEQEIDNLRQVLEYGKVSFGSDSNPRVATTLDQMRKVFTLVNRDYLNYKSSDPKRHMLTRLHMHTLAYQAILTVKGSEWKNSKNAAAKAALTAYRHVCGTDMINPESCFLILDDSFATSIDPATLDSKTPKRVQMDLKNPVSCWDESLEIDGTLFEYEICVAPVLVCREAKQTAGAGDNISASGLVLQI